MEPIELLIQLSSKILGRQETEDVSIEGVAIPHVPPPRNADPLIVTLAERANLNWNLRELMKRVAIGRAEKPELAAFQRVIDDINETMKTQGGKPSKENSEDGLEQEVESNEHGSMGRRNVQVKRRVTY